VHIDSRKNQQQQQEKSKIMQEMGKKVQGLQKGVVNFTEKV